MTDHQDPPAEDGRDAEADPLDWLETERQQPGTSRVSFDRQLQDCDDQLVAVAEMVAHRVRPVTEAFLEADEHAAGEVIAADTEVDRRCRRLEEACFLLLARQAPVAGDLRRIVAVLRSTGDVQRAGDLLRHVAESLAWVHPPSMGIELRDMIGQLGAVAGEVFDRAVAAWRSHDALAAVDLQDRDDQVDLLQKALLTELYTGQQTVEEAVSLALICRYYERIADHGVEMAREVAYFVTGDRPEGD
ncbi:MAG: phosphate signaling complex protein PhoU [Egibacteraceae bacterium]